MSVPALALAFAPIEAGGYNAPRAATTALCFDITGHDPVELRFYIDPDTGDPHILEHNVDEGEVADVLAVPLEVRRGHDGSRIALGQTRAGRYLRVVYVPDADASSAFVVTAYDLSPREKQALKRRRRKRP